MGMHVDSLAWSELCASQRGREQEDFVVLKRTVYGGRSSFCVCCVVVVGWLLVSSRFFYHQKDPLTSPPLQGFLEPPSSAQLGSRQSKGPKQRNTEPNLTGLGSESPRSC